MRPGWSKVVLEDVATIVGRGITPKYAENGDFQVINQKCVRNGRVSFEPARWHDSEQRAVREDKILQPDDILVNSTGVGTLGRTAPVRNLNGPTTVDSHLTIVRSLGTVDPRWLAYAISFAEPEIVAMAEGSTGQTELSRYRLAQLELSLPTLSEQKLIAATLGALDDKIDSNDRVQRICEFLVRALVMEAFRSSKGKEGILANYCNLIRDSVGSEEMHAEEVYIGLEHMPRGSIFLRDWSRTDGLISSKWKFQKGDVLFGKLRPYFKKVGIVPIGGVCSTDILVLRAKEAVNQAIVAVIASSDELIDSLSAAATGTRMPRTSWTDLKKWPIPTLLKGERDSLSRVVSPLLSKAAEMTCETLVISALHSVFLTEFVTGRTCVLSGEPSS